MTTSKSLVPIEIIQNRILIIRGQKVIIDVDLAEIYGVGTKVLNQAVSRNRDRFPEDFMFQLNKEEFKILRSQIVTSSGWGGRRYPPYAFTEHGAVMAASVLNSPGAIAVSVQVVRAYVKLRELLASDKVIKDIALLKQVANLHGKDIGEIKKILNYLIETPRKTQTPNRLQNKRRQIIYCTLCLKCEASPCILTGGFLYFCNKLF